MPLVTRARRPDHHPPADAALPAGARGV